MEQKEKIFAVIENGKVGNLVVGIEPEVLAVNLDKYIELTDNERYSIGDEISPERLKKIKADKAKQEAEAKAAAEKAEAERVKALELELERARQAEADRLAAEEAAKPKPVTGIFVKVEKN